MSKTDCVNCKYFHGYDGVGELWIGCSVYGDFKAHHFKCDSFEKKVTKADLLKKIRELEKELEELQKELNKK